MNRRNFLKFLGAASVGATVAYSFPSVIVPKNIELIDQINWITGTEIYPKLIEDFWFQESPFMTYMKNNYVMKIVDNSEYGFGYVEQNGVWVHETRKTNEEDVMLEDIEPVYLMNTKEIELVPKSNPSLLNRIFGVSS